MELLERDQPLHALEGALGEALAGRGRVALVSGEAGLGKTQLVERFVHAHGGGVRVLWGVCDALVTPRPLGPIYDIAAQTRGELLALLQPEAERGALAAALVAALSAQPAVVVIEDVHWADEATLDLLRHLGRRIARTRALLVLTYRDDELGPRHPLRTVLGDLTTPGLVRRIALKPLSEAAVRTLVGERRLDAAAIHRQTGGNPFFVTEVLAGDGAQLPATVRDAVLARAARLSPPAAAVLQAAAVVGPRIEPWLLAAVAAEAAEAATECLAHGMLVGHGDTLSFRHELARQTVLATLPPAQRLNLHRRTLAALRAAPTAAADLARLAHHAEAADDAEATRAFAPAAARQASATGAHREAAALYALVLRYAAALPPAEQAELLEAYADECNAIDQRAEALKARQQALDLWRMLGERLRLGEALAHTAILHNGLGDSPAATRACDEAVALLADPALPPSRALAFAYRTRAGLLMLNHAHAEAIHWGQQAVALARALGDDALALAAQVPIGSAWLHLDYPRGHALLTEVITRARAAGRVGVAAHAYANLGSASSELHHFSEAERQTAAGLAYTAEHGQERFRLYLLAWQAMTELRRGQWDAVLDTAGQVLQRSGVSATSRVTALAALGCMRARRGDPIAAIVLEEALELLREMGSLHRVGLVRGARAEAAWLAGEPEAALAEANAAFDLACATRHPWFAGELAYWKWQGGEAAAPADWMALPYRLQLSGDWRAAAQAWERLGCPYEQARALAEGDPEAQTAALALFNRLGAHPAADLLRARLQAAGHAVPRGPRPATRAHALGLTARQAQVLTLLAEGLTNPEIAARLFLSAKTVEHHVSAILARLEVATREEAAAKLRSP